MDTVYYDLKARRIKVSGGADLLTFVPTPVESPRGEVLDFERCRRRLETKTAWKDLEQAAAEVPEEPAEDIAPRSRRERGGQWLELAASAAVLLTAVAAAFAFLQLV